MPRLAEKMTVDYWDGELTRAKERREALAKVYRWQKLQKLHNSGGLDLHAVQDSATQSASPSPQPVFVNWVFSFLQTFVPAVYWRHPKVFCSPVQHQFEHNAMLAQSKINATMEMTNMRREVKKTILDAAIFGTGWMKLGWCTQYGEVPKNRSGIDSETRSSTLDYETHLIRDAAYNYRVSPNMIIVDPEAEDFTDMKWICHEYYKPLDMVKDDPFLSNKKDIADFRFKQSEGKDGTGKAQRSQRAWARIYEIWDREQDAVIIIAAGSSRPNRIIRPWPYTDLDGFPFEPLRFTEAIDEFYPPSIILPWLPLVDELSFVRTTRLDHLQRMLQKIVANEGVFSEDQIEALLDTSQEFVVTSDINGFKEVKGLAPDPQLYAAEERIQNDIREISGFSELLSGSVPFSRISATTSAIMERNSTLRFDHASEQVGEFIKSCAQKLFLITREYQTYKDQVKITGDTGQEIINYDRKDIEGEYLFTINVEDMAMITRQQRIKESYDKLVALNQFPEVKKWPLLRDMLRAFGEDEVEVYLHPPQGPPLDPGVENQMMLAGAPVRPNVQDSHDLHLQVHRMFLNSPEFAEAVALQPQLNALFSEHIQLTLNLMQQQQAQSPAPRAGSSPSLQAGGANATSQPVAGAQNSAGPQGSPLLQVLGGYTGQ